MGQESKTNKQENKPVKSSFQGELDKLKAMIAFAKSDEGMAAGMDGEEMKKAMELTEIQVKRMEITDFPQLSDDGIITMNLMKGGAIRIVEPMGLQIMEAKREMAATAIKGVDEANMAVYTMVACSTLSDIPGADEKSKNRKMNIYDVGELLTARDLNVLLSYFTRINFL